MPGTTFTRLIVEATAPVSTVTVNRPDVRNALDAVTLDELELAFATVAHDPGVRCIILTGAGDRAFVAGADIAAMATMGAAEAKRFSEKGHGLAAMMAAMPPIVAAVNGFALGGGLELALACDFMIVSSTARLGLPEVGLGVIPGFGGTQRLVPLVGVGRARELVYTGRQVTAEEAVRIGLASEMVEPAELMPRARAIAETIATRGPLAVKAAKAAIALWKGAPADAEQGLKSERDLFAALFKTGDQKEGMNAFLEKRPPRFQGR